LTQSGDIEVTIGGSIFTIEGGNLIAKRENHDLDSESAQSTDSDDGDDSVRSDLADTEEASLPDATDREDSIDEE